VGLATAAVARRRASGWTVAGVAVAVVVAAPLLVLPLSFVAEPGALGELPGSLLPDALRASLVLALGVGLGTLLLGGALAALVSFYDFPGRRWLDWALILPLAMPGYVLVFVLLGQYDASSPLQRGLRSVFGSDFQLPEIRSTLGTIVVLTLVLYPYVYALARAAFLGQARDVLEAARSLGMSYGRALLRVALPLARPALAAGVALAVMEALADFGTVNLLGYRAMTDAIYKVWYGTYDQAAAVQLAMVLVSLTFALVVLERLLRGRARHLGAQARGEAVVPRRLRGPAAWLACLLPALLLVVVLVAPVVQLVAWSVDSLGEGAAAADLGEAAALTVLLATIAALITLIGAVLIVYGRRRRSTPASRLSVRLGAIGYAVPGTVVAVAVYVPLAWTDHRLNDAFDAVLGVDVGLIVTGTILGLVAAYVVRFMALAILAVDTRMSRLDASLDDAARSLGAGPGRILSEVHLPLLWPGLVTAALLVFVEVMKELPATALLRPLGGDTLAVAVWEATKDSRFDTAALPALLIVLVGLVPVIVMVRLTRSVALERGLTAPPPDPPGPSPTSAR
jgi:iron(III) transport system permease protein